MGHLTMETILRPGLEALPEVDARFLRLPPLRGLPRQVVRPVPGLRALDADLQALRWHATQAIRARRLVGNALQTTAADVLHVHSHVLAFGMGGIMRRVPTVLSVDATVWDHHAMGIWRPVRRHSRAVVAPSVRMERRALAGAALVLAWSAWAKLGVEAVSPTARVIVHHPGIDTTLYRPEAHVERQVPRVLFVGNRFTQKGGADVVAALSPALTSGNVELDVVTQSEVDPHPGVRVHRFGVHDPGLIRLYQQADVFCLPSHADASPWAVLEALSCGTPVVGSDVGGIPDLIGDGGFTVRAGDVPSLRQVLDRLIGDEAMRHALGRCARIRAVDHFDAQRNIAGLVTLLGRVAQGYGD